MLKPFQKGQSGNPQGGSKKATLKHELKVRYNEILSSLKRADIVEKNLLQNVLQEALNSTEDELKTLLERDDMPFLGKTIIRECIKNPDFALKLFDTYFKPEATTVTNVVVNHTETKSAEEISKEYNRIKALFVE